MPFRLGLPQWQHPRWKKQGITTLADYARYFNCVEGNTTLYALPETQTVLRWRDMTDDHFRFCFKFPGAISHRCALQHCDDLTTAFFRRFDPLAQRIGHYWLQLPATFGPASLSLLWRFLDKLPADFCYSVEVRHPAFFNKGDDEQKLNRGLHQRNVNRVILDSRAVHASRSTSPAALEAKRKKPRLPVHAVITATKPMIRFIGGDSPTANQPFFADWLQRLPGWCERSEPWLFLHTPDIGNVLDFVQFIWPELQRTLPQAGSAPSLPQQTTLF